MSGESFARFRTSGPLRFEFGFIRHALEESEQSEQEQNQNDGHDQPNDAIRSAHPFLLRAGLTRVRSNNSVCSCRWEHHRPTE